MAHNFNPRERSLRVEKRAFITVMGEDRVGIIASVTQKLYEKKCNLEDISMTLLDGQFAMMMAIWIPKKGSLKRIGEDLRDLGKKLKVGISIHEFKPSAVSVKKSRKKNYLIHAIGLDQVGIVHRISQIMSKHQMNIVDLNSKVLERRNRNLYALVLEIETGPKANLREVRSALQHLSKRMSVDLQIHPVQEANF